MATYPQDRSTFPATFQQFAALEGSEFFGFYDMGFGYSAASRPRRRDAQVAPPTVRTNSNTTGTHPKSATMSFWKWVRYKLFPPNSAAHRFTCCHCSQVAYQVAPPRRVWNADANLVVDYLLMCEQCYMTLH